MYSTCSIFVANEINTFQLITFYLLIKNLILQKHLYEQAVVKWSLNVYISRAC